MDIQQTPEEKLKTDIYDIYTRFFVESSSERRQVYYGQIWDKIVKWCNKYLKYLKINANDMGIEIFNVIKRLVKDNNETTKNKSEFFYILEKSVENAKYEYLRKYEQGSIDISREKNRKFMKVKKELIKMKEHQPGKNLTKDEEEKCISNWLKNKQEYIDIYNAKNIASISYIKHDENDEIDDIDLPDTQSDDPLDEYINNIDMETVLEAVTSVFTKKQKRARDCYKALFTLYCIKNDLKGLYPILDQEIIDTFHKHGKKPKQYEIYLKYHPEADKNSAEVMASTNLREFLNDIETHLKEKNR
ncbi:hypothetical protein [Treponema sp. R6D11]